MMINEQFYYEFQKRLNRIKDKIDNFPKDAWGLQAKKAIAKINLKIKLIEKSIKNHSLEQIDDKNKDEIASYFDRILLLLESIEREHNPSPHIEFINNLLERILEILPKSIIRNISRKNNLDFEEYTSKIEEFEETYNQLSEIRNNINSLHTKIKNKDKEISKQAQEIQEKYNVICQDEYKDSLYTEIVKNSGRISQIEKQAAEQLKTISQNLEEFEKKFQENNEFLKGLEQQREKISNWEKEIENLLREATNASLASSYEETRKSYNMGIRIWHITFFTCIIIMFLLSVLSIFDVSITTQQIDWKLNIDVDNYLSILNSFLIRLPFYIPLAWLAIFATNRRNENKRLQEEYRHKETLAKAYSGYKEQIEKLDNTKAKELAEKLMDKLVEMTNENPNRSLDKVKKEKIPTLEMLEKLKDLPQEILSLISRDKK